VAVATPCGMAVPLKIWAQVRERRRLVGLARRLPATRAAHARGQAHHHPAKYADDHGMERKLFALKKKIRRIFFAASWLHCVRSRASKGPRSGRGVSVRDPRQGSAPRSRVTLWCGLAPAAAPRRPPRPFRGHRFRAHQPRIGSSWQDLWRAWPSACTAGAVQRDKSPDGWHGVAPRARGRSAGGAVGAGVLGARPSWPGCGVEALSLWRVEHLALPSAYCLFLRAASCALPVRCPAPFFRCAQAQNQVAHLIGVAGGSSKGSQPCLRE